MLMELELEDGFLRFDGKVIEYFYQSGKSFRYHIRYIRSIELVSGRKEIKLLDLRYGKDGGSGFRGSIIPTLHLPQAEKFIKVVMAALAGENPG